MKRAVSFLVDSNVSSLQKWQRPKDTDAEPAKNAIKLWQLEAKQGRLGVRRDDSQAVPCGRVQGAMEKQTLDVEECDGEYARIRSRGFAVFRRDLSSDGSRIDRGRACGAGDPPLSRL